MRATECFQLNEKRKKAVQNNSSNSRTVGKAHFRQLCLALLSILSLKDAFAAHNYVM
jgi:hypothetical protein